MIKRNWMLIGLLVLVFLMVGTACSAEEASAEVSASEEDVAQAEAAVENETSQESPGNNSTGRLEGTGSTQLILGSFRLESTDFAITAEQAEVLLPLWKGYQALIGSDTASSIEQEALLNQISEEYTAEQMSSFTETETNPQDMAALMEEFGIEMAGGGMMGGRMGEGEEGENGMLDDAQREEMQALREANGGGEGPGGGLGGGGGQEVDPEQLATMQAERAANGGGARENGQDEMFLPVLIELLESKINQ